MDIFAPGSSITSAWYTSNTATNTISGTSMASPHVAGAAAVYLQANPSATPAQVASALIAAATTGKVTNPGSGSPNRLLYIAPPGGGGHEPAADRHRAGPARRPTRARSRARAATSYVPTGGSYATTVSGTHRGCFTGTGRDFDLYLQKLSGSDVDDRRPLGGSSSTESITYTGTAGSYRWRVYSYSGCGNLHAQLVEAVRPDRGARRVDVPRVRVLR